MEALVGRLAGRSAADRAAELEELSRQVGDLQGVEHRVLELEERLDFAERLLTSGRQATGRDADTPPEPVDSVR
jgi:hypothetical protein